MKIGEMTVQQVAGFLRLPDGEYSQMEVLMIMDAAKAYISSYTGIPVCCPAGCTLGDPAVSDTLDDHDDLTIAFLVLCQDMYDNRTTGGAAQASAGINRTLDTILGMHERNLV